jgi:hypothetical protein
MAKQAFIFSNSDRFTLTSLLICAISVTTTGCANYPQGSPQKIDPSASLEERRERSVSEDPTVRGVFPNDWLVLSEKGSATQRNDSIAGSPEAASNDLDENEITEFRELFGKSKAPRVLEAEVAPGATRALELKLDGPSGLVGSAQWIGTGAPMKTTMAVNGYVVGSSQTFRLNANWGGASLQAQTPVGGKATLALTNTTNVNVKIRLSLVATSR